MLHRLLPLLLVPFIIFAGQQIQMEYTFDTPKVIKGKVYMAGCKNYGLPGTPALPKKATRLYLGHGIEPESFTVTYGNPISLGSGHAIEAYKKDISPSMPPEISRSTQLSEVYARDAFYPASVKSKNFTVQRMFGHNIFITWFNPVQYNPVSGKLQYFKTVNVTVNLTKVRSELSYRYTPFIKSQLALYVDNAEALENLAYDTRAKTCDYLIVTTEALKSSFGTFIDFNKRRGLRTKVVSVDEIKSTYQGEDDAAKVRACIKDEYEKTGIHFVLLGGDDERNQSNDVGGRGFWVEMYDNGKVYWKHENIRADMYFGTLDGTWKKSGSRFYGEYGTEDKGYEVFVARFGIDDVQELNRMVNKTIKYSENPVKDKIKNAFFAGEFLWNNPNNPSDKIWGGDNLDLIIGTHDIYNQKNSGFPTSGWKIEKLYDKDQTWLGSKFRSKVRDIDPLYINHNGHANTNYCFKIYNNNINDNEFDNDGTNANFFLAYSAIGCYPGAFDNMDGNGSSYKTEDCLGEKWTAEVNNGCVAFVGNSRTGWGGDYDENSASGRPHRWFYDALFGQGIHHISQMRAYVYEQDADIIACGENAWNDSLHHWGGLRWAVFELNILGDPALSLWTDTPKDLNADHPKQCAGSDTKFVWDTKKPYTTVALLKADGSEIICSQITGADGKCEITDDAFKNYVSANVGKKIKIHVKAHNYLPYAGEIEIKAVDIVNPVNPVSYKFTFNKFDYHLSYTLPKEGNISIAIYNSRGMLVRTVIDEFQRAGDHMVSFRNKALSNGMYYCRMVYDNNHLVNKFVVNK